MAKKRKKNSMKGLAFILGLAGVTLIGLTFEKHYNPTQFSPGAATPLTLLPAYWLAAALMFVAGLFILVKAFKR